MKQRRYHTRRKPVYTAIILLDACVAATLLMVLALQSQPATADMASMAVITQPVAPVARAAKQGLPVRVVVAGADIDVAVKTGSYRPEDDSWTLDESSAFYADRTVPANSSNGTTLIYGHGTASIFANLPLIRERAVAKVYTDNGLIFTYTYQSSRQITPADTSLLVETGPPTLLLQTCSGAFDAYRTMAVFALTGVTGYE